MAKGYDLYPGSGVADELIQANTMLPLAQLPQKMFQNIMTSRRMALAEEDANRRELQRQFDRQNIDRQHLLQAIGGTAGDAGGGTAGRRGTGTGAAGATGEPEIYVDPVTGERVVTGAPGLKSSDVTADMFPVDVAEQHRQAEQMRNLYKALDDAEQAQARYMAEPETVAPEEVASAGREEASWMPHVREQFGRMGVGDKPSDPRAAADKQVKKLVPGKKKRPKVPVTATRVEYGPEYIESRREMQKLFPEAKPKAGEQTVSDMVQALPVDETGVPTEELPSFMPQDDAIDAEPWTTTERTGTYYDPDTGREMTPDDVVKELIAGGVPEKSAKKMVKPATTYLPGLREHGVGVTREDIPEDPYAKFYEEGGGPEGSQRNAALFETSRTLSSIFPDNFQGKQSAIRIAKMQAYETFLRDRGEEQNARKSMEVRNALIEQETREKREAVEDISEILQSRFRYGPEEAATMADHYMRDQKGAEVLLGEDVSLVLKSMGMAPQWEQLGRSKRAGDLEEQRRQEEFTKDAVDAYTPRGDRQLALLKREMDRAEAAFKAARANDFFGEPQAKDDYRKAATDYGSFEMELNAIKAGEDTTGQNYTKTIFYPDGTSERVEVPSFASGKRGNPVGRNDRGEPVNIPVVPGLKTFYGQVHEGGLKAAAAGAMIATTGQSIKEPIPREPLVAPLKPGEVSSIIAARVSLGEISPEGADKAEKAMSDWDPKTQRREWNRVFGAAERRRADGGKVSALSPPTPAAEAGVVLSWEDRASGLEFYPVDPKNPEGDWAHPETTVVQSAEELRASLGY